MISTVYELTKKIKSMISHVLKIIFNICIAFLDLLIPTKKNLIGFGSNGGKILTGNTKALFDYFLEKNRFDCYFLTSKKDTQKKLSETYRNKILYRYSFKGIFKLLRTNWFFSSHGRGDYFSLPIENTSRIFQIWHGKLYKNDGLLISTLSDKNSRKLKLNFSKITAMTASSPLCKYLYAAAYGVEANKILPFGFPRDDIILYNKEIALEKQEHNKKILYAPTYRDMGEIVWFPFPDFNIMRLNSWLKRNNIWIFLRSHINEEFQFDIENYSNIHTFLFNDYPSIAEFLHKFDILITDYSSIYLDFILLDKPCIFLDYDFEIYMKYRGLVLPREIISIGDHPSTQKEFIATIKNALKDPRSNSHERTILSKIYNQWSIGDSREKIHNYIIDNL